MEDIPYLHDLPYETLFNIILDLPLSSLPNYCSTSHQANLICQDEYFWQLKFNKDFGNFSKPEFITWKEYYKFNLIEPSSPISVGNFHYGIIDNKGDLYMGGHGWEGQVGGGDKTKKANNPPTKIELGIPRVSKVICVSCSSTASGAVTEDGNVYIWGALHNSFTEEDLYTPTLVKLNKPALKISVVPRGYVVILNDFSICYNLSLTFGNEERSGYLTNIRVRDIYPQNNGFTFVTHTFQVHQYQFTRNGEFNITEIPFPEPIRHVLTDSGSSMALSLAGNLYTWGDNSYGQLGQGDLINRDNPIKVNIGKKINSISVNWGKMAAVTEKGELYIWGDNNDERLVGGPIDRRLEIVDHDGFKVIPTPIQLALPSPSTDKSAKVREVAIGWDFTMALTEDGEIKVWGNFPTKLEE
jgi:alpha-tubulin suppressor-like RCC1 family protein